MSRCSILVRLAPRVLAGAFVLAAAPAFAQSPGPASSAPATPAAEAPAPGAGLEGTTDLATIAGRLRLPLALPERDRLLGRELGRGFTASEDVRLDAPDGQALVVATALITPEGFDAAMVSEVLALTVANLAGEEGVDDVRPVSIGGFRFHLVRRDTTPSASEEEASDPSREAVRLVVLMGAVQQVLVRITLRVPASLQAHEDALVEAMAGLELDFASLLQQRAAFDEEAALAISEERVSTLFGDIPRRPGMIVRLGGTHVLQSSDGLRNGNGQVLVFARQGFWNVQFATLSLSCELQPEGSIDEEVPAFVALLRADARGRESVGPSASRIGALPARRWAGRQREERGRSSALRALDADGVRYMARIDQTSARRFAEELEAWLDEGAVPQCAPRLPVQVGG